MPIISAGLLLYRHAARGVEVLLAHPGGPFWAKKDLGAWSIPKGEVLAGEEPLAGAHREFLEEMGSAVAGEPIALGSLRQRSGKIIHAWAICADFDLSQLRSNTFELEWPRHSGTLHTFPEVDRAAWFDFIEARRRILPGQAGFLDALEAQLKSRDAVQK